MSWVMSACSNGSDFPVSHLRGRCVAIGDSFHWFYADEMNLAEKHTDCAAGAGRLGVAPQSAPGLPADAPWRQPNRRYLLQ